MLGQQLITNTDPKQKFMVYGMPVLMFFFFRNLPSGLVLYWTVYNVLSIVEQKTVQRGLPVTSNPVSPPESAPRKLTKK
jgi:YidC/Oxa1 family membrane protein insertase